ncbi:MAG: iron-sulfur cluster biosynthesis family protein [Balneolales bacterium]
MNITITPQAREKVDFLLREGEMAAAEIRLVSGCAGCGGLTIGLLINDPRDETDKMMKVDGVTVFIEHHSEEYIGNTIVDYVDNEYGGNFIISNEYGSSVCFV